MGSLLRNLIYAARSLRRNPSFTVVAVLSLALGIGANTAIFSLIYAVLLRPLPVREPQRLLSVYTRYEGGHQYITSSYPDYKDFRDQTAVFSGLAAYKLEAPMSLGGDGSPEPVVGQLVTGNYFSVLGVEAARGRTFLPEEDYPFDSGAVCVLSDGLWKQRFRSDPEIVGRRVILNGYPFTVVGVLPQAFAGIMPGMAVDIWITMSMVDRMVPYPVRMEGRGSEWLEIVGRLKPGVTFAQVTSRLQALSNQLAEEYPNSNRNKQAIVVPLQESRIPLHSDIARSLPAFMTMLLGVVGLVLLIACSNLANLLLARGVGLQKEIAMRLALGAGRTRVVCQLLTESVLLALIGGAVGILVATWAAQALKAFMPPTVVPVTVDLTLDGPVLLFALAASLGAAVLFGLFPALQAVKPELVPALKDQAAFAVRGVQTSGVRSALVVAQVALSLVLLIGTGLFLKSLRNASRIDPGFKPQNMLLASINIGLQGYDEARGRQFYQTLLERIRPLSGVHSAALGAQVPLGFDWRSRSVSVPGYEPGQGEFMSFGYNGVSPGYFETLGTPLVSGRGFLESDNADAAPVVVINETMARRFWPGRDPLDTPLRVGDTEHRVIGVAKDGKYRTLGETPSPYYYLPLLQRHEPSVYLHVRTRADPSTLVAPVLKEIRTLDPNLPVFDVKTMTDHMGFALLPARLASSMFGAFGLVALLLAVVGLYGVISYWVNQKTREIGIRTALGAGKGDVLKLILERGLKLTGAGIVCGLVAAVALGQVVAGFLYGVSPVDAATFVAVPVMLALVAMLACYLPARRATKVDPMMALRNE